MRWAYFNGEIVPAERALVRADSGAVYGRGLVETMRSYDGRLLRFGAHYERLLAGAAVLGIDVGASMGDLEGALVAVLERNGVKDARLRLIVTDDGPERASIIAIAGQLLEGRDALRERGMSAVISETRRNEMSPLSRIKSLQRVDDQLAREAARGQGADEAILLNTRGEVAEGSVSNVFVVSDGRLVTPSIESGALPGIARQVVLEIAAASGIEAREQAVSVEALRAAGELFITNSVIEVAALTRLDDEPIGDGKPGPVTLRLRQMYRDLVARETVAAPAG